MLKIKNNLKNSYCYLFIFSLISIFCISKSYSKYYYPKLYNSVLPDCCLHHLINFPKESSEWNTDKNDNPYCVEIKKGSSSFFADSEIIDKLSLYLNLIPKNDESCDFRYCNKCNTYILRGIFQDYNYDDDEYFPITMYKCNCINWYDEDPYDYEEYDDDVEEFIEDNWKFCSKTTVPNGYFDIYSKQYILLFEQYLKYCHENKGCKCYWPYCSKSACEINDLVYDSIKPLIEECLLDELNESKEFLNLKNRTSHGALCCLFYYSFFYSQYRQILLNLNVFTESNLTNNTDVTKVLDTTYDTIDKLQAKFLKLYSNCLNLHPHPKIYYERGMIFFHRGKNFEALSDINKLMNSEMIKDYDEKSKAEICFQEGKFYAELGLYDKAVEDLTNAILKNPENKEAYFERAGAYFELGEFDKAISDFLETGMKSANINKEDFSSLLFAKGLIGGILKGGKDGAVEFVPSALASLQGLSHGLWAFTTDPKNCSKQIVEASRACMEFIKDSSSVEIMKKLVPELQELIENWTTINDEKKGNLTGYVIGKYGIDILMTSGSIKAVQAYRNLKKANNLFTLEMVSKNITKGELIKEASNALNKRNLEAIKKIKDGEAFLKPYKGQYMPENTVRKVLHQAGFKTFSRPKGIPNNYLVKLSDRGGGMKYVNPKNSNEYVRVMPGKPHSSNIKQQKPYVNCRGKEGLSRDKFGNKIQNNIPEAHIPIDEFEYFQE